ncbi:MAG: VOC family protein [Ilumatobacter sp.]|nr:VOC family protein [Ilumatobacter sp.]
MTIPQRLSIVTLGVADLAVSTAFYESVGWKKSASSQDTITFFQMEGSVLALYERAALADDAQVPADGDGFRGVTLAIMFPSPAEVDAAYAEWVAAGAAPRVVPHTAFWGGHSSYVADPDGHLWELAYNPYAENGPDGRMMLAPPAD